MRQMKRKVDRVTKQSDWANVVALTKTAWDVKKEEEAAMSRYLHNPTPFTRKAYLVKRATRQRKCSQVFAKRIQEKYLSVQVHGGSVSKRVPVPPQQAKNKYGNLPRTATKGKRVYHVKSKGKDLTFRRTGKRTTKLIGVWSDRRTYKQRLPFYEIGKKRAYAVYGGHLKREFRKAMRGAR